MLLCGFGHGIVFPGDIIGAYGLVAVLLANLLARKNYGALYLTAGIISVVALGMYLATGTLSAGAAPTTSEDSLPIDPRRDVGTSIAKPHCSPLQL